MKNIGKKKDETNSKMAFLNSDTLIITLSINRLKFE